MTAKSGAPGDKRLLGVGKPQVSAAAGFLDRFRREASRASLSTCEEGQIESMCEEGEIAVDICLTAMPHSRLTLIAGAGHISNMEKPRKFNANVRRFLSQRIDRRPTEDIS
jgi:hypothetical protein